jgi:hypothetical protein
MSGTSELVVVEADGIFPVGGCPLQFDRYQRKSTNKMPIVAEPDEIADRRNSPLKSRARGGSAGRYFILPRKVLRRPINGLSRSKMIERE